jgi:hypothetical protein
MHRPRHHEACNVLALRSVVPTHVRPERQMNAHLLQPQLLPFACLARKKRQRPAGEADRQLSPPPTPTKGLPLAVQLLPALHGLAFTDSRSLLTQACPCLMDSLACRRGIGPG